MYSTCIFCNSDLGANEVIEHFPVGRRLAFDAEKGRLWAICRKCARWNLSPLEERWEAIEECERLFRGTRLRVSTDNVGLARVREGLELVRIGQPQRPEMAAWRYGDQFGRRRRRHYLLTGAIVAGVGGVYFVGPALGLYAFGGFGLVGQLPNWIRFAYRGTRGRVRLPMPGAGKPLLIRAEHVAKAQLLPDDSEQGWALRVPFAARSYSPPDQPLPIGAPRPPRIEEGDWGKRFAVFTGDEALRVAGKVLPKVNIAGAGKDEVQSAVRLLERSADPHALFASHIRRRRPGLEPAQGTRPLLSKIPKPMRLALEMAAHEDTERRALEGELAMLEAAWKEADEIAAISDTLVLPGDVDAWLTRLKLRMSGA
jgi:hypothetical protein